MTFPKELKLGDISSLLKKDDKFSKKNYRPIATLPSASKIYERNHGITNYSLHSWFSITTAMWFQKEL